MSSLSEQTISSDLAELSRKTGLVIRPLDSEALNNLFTRLEKYDAEERAETFGYLRRALNETRTSVGAEPVFDDE